MLLRAVLDAEQKRLKTSLGVIEQDYILSYLLHGISSTDILRNTLVFKGGTALKKIYFGDYRFSQDLDFTALDEAPKGNGLEEYIHHACFIAEEKLAKRAQNSKIVCSRYTEKRPHPNEQEAFVIRAQLPWHRSPFVRVMIEVTRNQRVVNKPVMYNLIHGYKETLSAEILTYTLDEIFGEKLIAMYSNAKKLHEQGWARSRSRDYYDLWMLLKCFRDKLDRQKILNTILYKYHKPLSITSINEFFDEYAMQCVVRDWERWLGPILYPLPESGLVIRELREQVAELLDYWQMPINNDVQEKRMEIQ